jgi:hypothetical protein
MWSEGKEESDWGKKASNAKGSLGNKCCWTSGRVLVRDLRYTWVLVRIASKVVAAGFVGWLVAEILSEAH